MKIHYCAYPTEHECPPACGTEETENTKSSSDWGDVTCLKCLRNRKNIDKCVEETETRIVKDMGDMADFYAEMKGHAHE